jgi:hypothetical protein
MDRSDDQTLFAELRELRPVPRPEFTAELDERAAAGFPRRSSRGRAGAGPLASLAAHLRGLRGTSSRGWLVPVVGMAIAVLATAGVVVAVSSNGGGPSQDLMTSAMSGESSGGGAEAMEAGGEEAGEAVEEEGSMHSGEQLHKAQKAPGVVHSQAAPKPARKAREEGFNGNFFDEGEAEGTVHGGEESAEESGVEEEPANTAKPLVGNAPAVKTPGPARGHRDVERSASIVLGTKPGEVAGAAAKVYTAVHAVGGVVLNSSVESGRAGPTGATFSLLIPSRKLDDALASFSRIAEVRSRHDATQDITGPTVSVTEELRDSNASIEGLLKELGDVETEEERESVEARLHEERRRHASIRASLEHLHKRASMSEVSVRIVTGNGAGVAPPPSKGGDWSVGDALHDAGHILTIAASVLLLGLAVLAPIALVLLLIWLANRFRVRRLRERALG